MKQLIKRYRALVLLIVVVLAGFLFRVYHFGDWLHFELDQARDARVVDAALAGSFLDLPLLGPRAAGTFLRLPPGFYYLEYGSALFFGSSPVGQAAVVPLFSVLALIAGYVFFRRFFDVTLALGLTSIMAVSTFLVMYGRFAWNPNLLPFFLIFGFYALLRAVDKDERHPGRFLLLSAFALGLSLHFHFLAVLAVPTITMLFLLLKRPRIRWVYWCGALGIVLVLFSPVMLNEIATGGRNTQEFVLAFTSKPNKGDQTFFEKIIRNSTEQSLGYGLLVTGYEGAELPRFKMKPYLDIICDGGCWNGLFWGIVFAIFYLTGSLLLFWYTSRPLPDRKRDFLLLSLLWFGVTWIVFTNIAYSIAPRFFLLVAPLPFLFVGLWLKEIIDFAQWLGKQKYGQFFSGVCVAILIVSNISFTIERFSQLARATDEASVFQGPDRILKERTRVTLRQQMMVTDFLQQRSIELDYPVYLRSESQYDRALKYLLEQKGVATEMLSLSNIYREGLYFLVLRTASNIDEGVKKYLEKYDELEHFPFGTLTVIELSPKPEAITAERQIFTSEKSQGGSSKTAPRYTWREWWTREKMIEEELETEEERDKDDYLYDQ